MNSTDIEALRYQVQQLQDQVRQMEARAECELNDNRESLSNLHAMVGSLSIRLTQLGQ